MALPRTADSTAGGSRGRRATAALAVAACGGDDGGPTEPPPEPTTGTLEVSAATTGDTLELDGSSVQITDNAEREFLPAWSPGSRAPPA